MGKISSKLHQGVKSSTHWAGQEMKKVRPKWQLDLFVIILAVIVVRLFFYAGSKGWITSALFY